MEDEFELFYDGACFLYIIIVSSRVGEGKCDGRGFFAGMSNFVVGLGSSEQQKGCNKKELNGDILHRYMILKEIKYRNMTQKC